MDRSETDTSFFCTLRLWAAKIRFARLKIQIFFKITVRGGILLQAALHPFPNPIQAYSDA